MLWERNWPRKIEDLSINFFWWFQWHVGLYRYVHIHTNRRGLDLSVYWIKNCEFVNCERNQIRFKLDLSPPNRGGLGLKDLDWTRSQSFGWKCRTGLHCKPDVRWICFVIFLSKLRTPNITFLLQVTGFNITDATTHRSCSIFENERNAEVKFVPTSLRADYTW